MKILKSNCTGTEASPLPSLGVDVWWAGCSFSLQCDWSD